MCFYLRVWWFVDLGFVVAVAWWFWFLECGGLVVLVWDVSRIGNFGCGSIIVAEHPTARSFRFPRQNDRAQARQRLEREGWGVHLMRRLPPSAGAPRLVLLLLLLLLFLPLQSMLRKLKFT